MLAKPSSDPLIAAASGDDGGAESDAETAEPTSTNPSEAHVSPPVIFGHGPSARTVVPPVIHDGVTKLVAAD